MLFNTIFYKSPLLGGLLSHKTACFEKRATKIPIKIKLLSLAFH
ncbi:hypothetical protein HPHPH41_0076 [Helicobacter pylori Hp H-41]|nr:hypothetical protein HPHPH41_0076 [Helicobacter pylori Hp H-41]